MSGIIDLREKANSKDMAKNIAFHYINKMVIAAIQKGELAQKFADMSFDDDFAVAKWAEVQQEVLDSFNTSDLYQKICVLFNTNPVDMFDLVNLYHGPCYHSITGRGATSEYKSEPLASLINFALYTFQ